MKLGRGVKIHSKTSVPASPHVKSLVSDSLRSRKPVICNFLTKKYKEADFILYFWFR